jgi:hypothetical protein
VKLKILASPSFLSAIFPEKKFYETFLKTTLVSPVKLLYGAKAYKLLH